MKTKKNSPSPKKPPPKGKKKAPKGLFGKRNQKKWWFESDIVDPGSI